jgi:hypothetical protein
MPYLWLDPNNPRNQYRTTKRNDPGVPTGYILTGGMDGAQDIAQQGFRPGACSGGFPRYPANSGNSIATDLRLLDGTGSTGV